MFAQHPDIAKRWVAEAKAAGKKPIQPKKKPTKHPARTK